jgi:hypothetical protein
MVYTAQNDGRLRDVLSIDSHYTRMEVHFQK